jgi:hypothetical protein
VRAGQSAPVDGRVGRANRRAWVVSPRRDSEGKKGVCTLEPPSGGPSWIAGDRTMTLAMPNKALSPAWGKSVGGVSERAGAKARREQSLGENKKLLKKSSFACRDGRRHPGFRKSGSLRGASLERRPRSARHLYPRFPPRVLSAPMTADVRRNAKEGNAVVLRSQCVGTGRRHGTPSHADRDASFTRSFDPFSSILTMHPGVKPGVVGRYRRYRGQANPGNWEELAPGSSERTERGSPRVTPQQ